MSVKGLSCAGHRIGLKIKLKVTGLFFFLVPLRHFASHPKGPFSSQHRTFAFSKPLEYLHWTRPMTPGNTCNNALWSLWRCHHAFWEIRHAGTCVSVWWIWAVPVIVARFLSVVSSFFYFIFGEWILVVKVLRWCVSPLHMHCHGKLQAKKKKNANGEMIVCLRMSTLLSVLGFFLCLFLCVVATVCNRKSYPACF